jgi:hypothetical protein
LLVTTTMSRERSVATLLSAPRSGARTDRRPLHLAGCRRAW